MLSEALSSKLSSLLSLAVAAAKMSGNTQRWHDCQISDMQQPRYGQQVLDMILPF